MYCCFDADLPEYLHGTRRDGPCLRVIRNGALAINEQTACTRPRDQRRAGEPYRAAANYERVGWDKCADTEPPITRQTGPGLSVPPSHLQDD